MLLQAQSTQITAKEFSVDTFGFIWVHSIKLSRLVSKGRRPHFPVKHYKTNGAARLTHRAFGGDGYRLQQHLYDAGAHPGGALVMGVQVAQDLLDDVVRVLCLRHRQEKNAFIFWSK